ncbi:plasmid pRiA4b ORF-3 family protein [Deinococcus peraridilitoris]|uniref:Plasmid pRiA4b ORF-3-like protein n=1 Tax=Deinococcus peraridilitoris (strain DSM 19664 / LMG 22246 / CIP 109416 / KR-200) TaxID=937777 RepID=L0A681_DEIPD|nr:plasmid pRiA4b ORF-3 family protein [Deinococcus peraridilitoris]AFZ69393.1 Plasmid pRiA4b ORF-3-like protein [Deinococcus peraridilitoris DSM 19664]
MPRTTKPKGAPTKAASSPTEVHQLKITLNGSKPSVWRRIQVPSTSTLGQLHAAIQLAFGWTNSHLHEFEIAQQRYTMDLADEFDDFGGIDEDTVTLTAVLPKGTRAKYLYDFGDSWQHTILVEDILPADPQATYPTCLTGKNACPPEDCGGFFGYAQMLEELQDPDHPEHETWLEWLGGDFDPKAFSVDEANARLAQLAKLRKGRRAASRQ